MDNKKKNLFIALVIYIASTLISYILFSNFAHVGGVITPVSIPKIGKDERVAFDESLPKTEECPLNGAKYSKPQKQWWEKHRPLGVMIENHQEARPQSGLSYADVVYEAVAEGGITRLLAVYYCQDAGIIGPVRSARTYFLDFISEYGDYPLYVHVGGANTPGPADALGQIGDYGWRLYNDLNEFSISYPTFKRDYDRLGRTIATEHTMYSSTDNLWTYAAKTRKLTNKDKDGNSWDENFVKYSFKEDAKETERPTSQVIAFNFWKGYGDYEVAWTYNKTTNLYARTNGGVPHKDKNNDKQITAKNGIVLFMTERRANDGYEGNLHMLYGTKGTGRASIFMDGQEINGTWSKKDRTSRLILRDNRGREIEVNKGPIWFAVTAIGTSVVVK
ncbi:MAG: DUF3048 domain-containing protein [Candidatus Levybacteria bacterium]|nr:DUF3048 domain-containing protein [Candidatus Levybacteria bacterium]